MVNLSINLPMIEKNIIFKMVEIREIFLKLFCLMQLNLGRNYYRLLE